MAKKTYDLLFKLLLIGDSGVGKTCILFREDYELSELLALSRTSMRALLQAVLLIRTSLARSGFSSRIQLRIRLRQFLTTCV
jgi:hypothetical protein